jgi:hypothetical protein
MEDDITIGVTEIVNNIEVTAQPNDQVIDIDVIDNSDSVTLNVTPNIIEVNVERGSSFARWGTIYGNILDQTDLQNALFNKADLVNGLVPAYQLPSFVDDVIEVANFASLPTTGETGKLYLTLDNNKIYRWGGSTYVEIASNQAIWGQITGTLSNQTDLQNALNLKADKTITITPNAPLTGGGDLSANRSISINQSGTSSDGFLSSTDWNTFNNKQNQLNGTGFVKASGTTISYDNTSYLPLSGGTMTGDLFLRANNDVGGTNYCIGQTMASNDSWKIYGNTIAFDRGELVFELGDNGSASSVNGQRFRFFYNNSSDGTAKSPFILDYNDAVFDANGSFSGNLGVANGNTNNFESFANQLVIGNGSTSVGMTIFTGSSNSGALYFADSTSGDDRRRGAITYNHLTNTMNLDTNAVNRIRINETGKVTINSGSWDGSTGGLFNISNGGQHGFEFVPNHSLGRNAIFSYNRTTLAYNTILYSALDHVFAGNGNELMRITSGGNVGIGTTSPNDALTVIGNQFDVRNTSGVSGTGYALEFATNSLTPRLDFVTNSVYTGNIKSNASAFTLNTPSGLPLTFEVANSERMRITSSGSVVVSNLGTGLVYSNAGALTSTNPSDERLKDDITDLQYGLNEILQLRPVSYNWKNDTINQGKQFGFIAQEVQEIMPELISEFTTFEDEEEVVRLGLDKEGIYATLVNAIKELKAEIDLLKQKA